MSLEPHSMPLLTVAAAAEYLAMSESGLRKLVKRRLIRYSQLGRWGRIRFRREWLDEFIAAGEVTPITSPQVRTKKRSKPVAHPTTDTRHGLDYGLLKH